MNLKIVILAAGQGTRMKSKHPKVLHKVMGKAMLDHVIEECKDLSDSKPVVVIGHMAEALKDHLKDSADTVIQKEQLGTGHAVMMAVSHIKDEEPVLILCADTPLIKKETLCAMAELKAEGYSAVVMSSIIENPTGYGRIIRDSEGDFLRIKEQKDADEDELKVREINAGMYIIDGKSLKENLQKLSSDNAQNEYYLTDVLEHIKKENKKIGVFVANENEILGVNSRVQLAQAEMDMKKNINTFHMENGVTIIDPNNTYIDKEAIIGRDTIIYPNVRIIGKTIIGEDVTIRENTTIENSKIEDNVVIKSSTITESIVGASSTIGPYAYLRPKSIIGKNVKIGDFVEVKNAVIGNGSKASHLSYIGDADVGQNVNIGCGVVFVNYDGKNKHRSIVKDNAFIGSNCNVVAPVIIEEKAYIATGSTVTIDIPKDSLCVARAREVIKEGWTSKKGILSK